MKLILVCLLALSVLASALPSGSIKLRAIQRRKPLVGIYGTQLAHIQKYPYTVSTYTNNFAMISGSGALLTNSWVLTTNYQLYGQSAEDITVRGGSDDGQSGGQSSKIAKVISNFTGVWSEDLALLKLKNKFTFNKKLKPVKLAKKLPSEGSVAALSGFGQNEIRSGVLEAGNFKISSYSKCKYFYVSDTIICSESDKYTPAFDDFGDPFVQKKKLVGIYSGYDESGPFFTFMAMPKFRDWIIETIKANSEGDEADGIDDDDDFDAQAYDNDEEDEDEADEDEEEDEEDEVAVEVAVEVDDDDDDDEDDDDNSDE